jgi:hypothetical protein
MLQRSRHATIALYGIMLLLLVTTFPSAVLAFSSISSSHHTSHSFSQRTSLTLTLPRQRKLSLPASTGSSSSSSSSTITTKNVVDNTFEMQIKLPGREGLTAQMKFKSIYPNDTPSQIIQVRYAIPFGLDVSPINNLATCTKDGVGGERVGDVLRYTSQWTLGLPRGDGVITTAMSFSGGISWQVSMFDIMKASKWESVVEALVSNEASRTNEVVLLFERPITTTQSE